ncbi:efflux RND transporter periplasmic adaptor subunit [Neosynechococcus sphagnicola]|nr:efflux RND transporter periplasmic adaptor subunit [Neosynechococcus sphagnicola]
MGTVLAFATGCSKQAAIAPPAAFPVQLLELQPASVQDTTEFVGKLEAIAQVQVRSEIQGTIQEILVREGDPVAAGTTLIKLQPDQTVPQLQSAQAAANGAILARATAFKDRQVSQARLLTAQSDLDLAQTNFKRAHYLLNEGAIATLRYDEAKNQLDAARNRLTAAKEQFQAADIAILQATANVHQAQAEVKAAKVSVGFKQIVAAIPGIVGDLPERVGDYVTTGQVVTTLTQNNALDLRLSIPSNRLNQLRLGLPVQLVNPNTKEQLTTGRINFIAPRVDAANQVILVKARFPNNGHRLKDGQFVEAWVIWSQRPGILIPTNAVKRLADQAFVYVAQAGTTPGKSQQIVRQRPVRLGTIQAGKYQVLEGLSPGDRIAVSNILKLKEGTPIQPQT